jgi:hypothetical protein
MQRMRLNFIELSVFIITIFFAKTDSFARTNVPPFLSVGPSSFIPSCLYEKPGEFHLRNNPNAPIWAKIAGGCEFWFPLDSGLAENIEVSLEIFDSYGATIAKATPDSAGVIYVDSDTNYIRTIRIYWNGTSSGPGSDIVHEGTYTAQLHYRIPNSANPIVLEQNFYVKKADGAKNNTCGTGYSLAFIPAAGFKFRRPFKKVFRKIFGRPS